VLGWPHEYHHAPIKSPKLPWTGSCTSIRIKAISTEWLASESWALTRFIGAGPRCVLGARTPELCLNVVCGGPHTVKMRARAGSNV
jgi:hypothetical protein